MDNAKLVMPNGVKWIIPKMRRYATLVRVLLYKGGRLRG